MNWKKTLALAGGMTGLAAYLLRKPVIARWFDLPAPEYSVDVHRDIRVPTEDGITLATDHYTPRAAAESTESFPTILIRTAYGKALAPVFHANRFAERGYHVLVQDVRGRFGSGGEFEPFTHEGVDGLATLSWLQKQSWFNGLLGTWGQSYLAYTQWALATAAPDAVAALCPSLPSSRGAFSGQVDDAQLLELPLRWMLILDSLRYLPGGNGPLAPWRVMWWFLPRGQGRKLKTAFKHVPLSECDELLIGEQVPFFRQFMSDPTLSHLQKTDLRRRLYHLRQPIHLLSGWYDFMLGDMLGDYAALREAGQAPYLTIGPWHHAHPEISRVTLREGLAWFDAHLKKKPQRLRQKAVKIYMMGADEWWLYDSWPPPSRATSYFLYGNHRLSTKPPAVESSSTAYRYDPHDPTPTIGGPLFFRGAGARDNRLLEARPDVVTFTSEELCGSLDVIGPVRAVLYVSSSVEHTDFFTRLCDVFPDGRSINVCEGIARICPGKVTPESDGVLRVEIDMWATAYRFRPGHALRLQLSSGAYPRFAPNPGVSPPLKSRDEMRFAHQTIYYGAIHPSHLILPVI